MEAVLHESTAGATSEACSCRGVTEKASVFPMRVSRGRRISLTKRLVFSCVPLLLLLASLEIAARCLGPAASHSGRFQQIEQIIVYLGNEPGQSIFEPDPDCFWHLKPNVVLPMDRGPMWGGMMSNSHGLHSRETTVAAAQDRYRVLCFGDSSTFAFGVGINDAWPSQLQQILDTERPDAVEVLNAGIPGQTTYQGRQRLSRELDKWQPHLAFITFGNNDGWRWDGMSDKEQANRSRIGRSLAFLDHSRAWQWLAELRVQSDRTQSAQQQLQWAQQATWNYFDPKETWTPRVSLTDFADNLKAMITECRRHNCEPILVVWPDQRQFLGQPTWRPPYQEEMRRVAMETKSRCLDLVPLFEQEGDWAIQRFLPRDVVHLDAAGNRFVSETVAEYVRAAILQQTLAQTRQTSN